VSPESANPNKNNDENLEWQLSELVDSIAAEVDRAADTLSLKSYARGASFAVKKLSLDLEVKVRRTADGKLLFRTVSDDKTSSTVLKLDFDRVLQNQLINARKPLDGGVSVAGFSVSELEDLPGITAEEMTDLGTVSIHSVDDLERYTQTPIMLAEVSRQTRIAEHRIRMWRQLPFIREVKPASAPGGTIVAIEGGNFGDRSQPNDGVWFQQKPAKIIDWRANRLTVEMPSDVRGAGLLVARIGDEITNLVSWEATVVDLSVRNLAIEPSQPVEGEEIVVTADLINQGNMDSEAFEVQWEVDGEKQELQPHGLLRSQQQSQESCIRRRFQLGAGSHILRFTTNPDSQRADINPTNDTFSKEVIVKTLHKLNLGDFRNIETFDPLLNDRLGPADVLSLIFRGLGRLHPETGVLVPDVAESWETQTTENGTIRFIVRLHDRVYFQDGTQLTVEDVQFTYDRILKQTNSPWHSVANSTISQLEIDRLQRTIALSLYPRNNGSSPIELLRQILIIGIIPKRIYEANPENFGRHPVGCGPFQLQEFIPNERISLTAFGQYRQGKPRLDRIDIHIVSDVNRLIEMVEARQAIAAVLPYSEVTNYLDRHPEWNLQSSPDSPEPMLLHVQTDRIYERVPNPFDINWNAHLWYY
jgi:peptide/nickel transport system substrate-binding protein